MSQASLDDVLRRDPRYPFEAYEFVFRALEHTQWLLGQAEASSGAARRGRKAPASKARHHVTGQDLLHGVRDLALREFGLLARAVFRAWGINATDDIGAIVFNLIDAELMSRTDEDKREDFHAVYDLDQALCEGYVISGRPQDEDEL